MFANFARHTEKFKDVVLDEKDHVSKPKNAKPKKITKVSFYIKFYVKIGFSDCQRRNGGKKR